MGIFDGAILLSDIDGTLLESGIIPERNIEKIEYFIKEGGCFSVATGRSVKGLSIVVNAFKGLSPSIVANGCMIYDYSKKQVLYEKNLPRSDYHFVGDVLKSDLSCGIEVHAGERVFTVSQTAESDDHQRDQGLETSVISFKKACEYSWNKVVFLLNSADDYVKIHSLVDDDNKQSCFVDTCTFIDGTKRNYLEQVPLNVSKQAAIEELCKILNIENGKRFAIGDYYNDVKMLENADISATTSEAPDEIKNISDFVGGSCKDGAVADFIDYLTEKLEN
ncbi:MAG: HAD-IIB family hydrolase [Clostridia bacterium]|nr:HAD-IIB family hydrolase [Oscillospiraceae bacterium]MBO5359096.1 HAD-IIB family hydrolase [Clostridia bacterium]